jgi:hypothetical protein
LGRNSEPVEVFDRPLESLNWDARAKGKPESVDEAIRPEACAEKPCWLSGDTRR